MRYGSFPPRKKGNPWLALHRYRRSGKKNSKQRKRFGIDNLTRASPRLRWGFRSCPSLELSLRWQTPPSPPQGAPPSTPPRAIVSTWRDDESPRTVPSHIPNTGQRPLPHRVTRCNFPVPDQLISHPFLPAAEPQLFSLSPLAPSPRPDHGTVERYCREVIIRPDTA